MIQTWRIPTALFAFATITGCAGPTTPLGAVWTLRVPPQLHSFASFARRASGMSTPPAIQASPQRQVLHLASPLTLTVLDPDAGGPGHKFTVLYNGLDVTASFMRQATTTVSGDHKKVTVKLPKVTLPAGTEHRIEFGYWSPSGTFARIELAPPSCDPFSRRSIASTEPFTPPEKLLKLIDRVSRESGFNPAFAAGLVAQESGFDPQSVSWARAIGLTQITSGAESELANRFQDWPRYPGLSELPFPWLKGLILAGEVNRSNEWRLDEERSVRGGLAYIEYLHERWAAKENAELLAASFEHPDLMIPKLVLASYNSGYARVRAALARERAAWLEAEELRGIRKYVDKITSYCDHFTAKEVPGERAS